MVLRGRSEREMMLATEELRKQHRIHSAQKFTLNARALAVFLESVEDHEDLLMQRVRDRECAVMRSGDTHRDDRCDTSASPAIFPEKASISADIVEIYGEF